MTSVSSASHSRSYYLYTTNTWSKNCTGLPEFNWKFVPLSGSRISTISLSASTCRIFILVSKDFGEIYWIFMRIWEYNHRKFCLIHIYFSWKMSQFWFPYQLLKRPIAMYIKINMYSYRNISFPTKIQNNSLDKMLFLVLYIPNSSLD